MTYAAVPALRADDAIAKEWTPLLASRRYDPGVRARTDKVGALAGMGMTEKQGGSDVRANVTQARPTSEDGWYTLHGHKWFTCAPMNDLFLVLAQAEGGVTCFVVPRVLADGTRNRIDVVRLKDKLGNRSNASSELELDGTVAQRLGDEGRGVRTIIEMVAATRLDCVLGSASLMRQALAEASWHVTHRSAFGGRLVDKPLMQNVVADLAVESEAATALGAAPRGGRRPAGRRPRGRAAPDRPAAGEVLGLQAHARPWSPRRWSAWAATATSRSPACRCSSASRRSTPSGRARATSTRSTCSRALSREPEALEAWITEVGAARGEDPHLDRTVDDTLCAARRHRLAGGRPPGGWPARWPPASRARCWSASARPRWPTRSARAGSGRRTTGRSAPWPAATWPRSSSARPRWWADGHPRVGRGDVRRPAAPHVAWGRRVLDRMRLEGDERVLDAGCGTGRDGEALLERWPGVHLVGIDGSEQMSRRRASASATAPSCTSPT